MIKSLTVLVETIFILTALITGINILVLLSVEPVSSIDIVFSFPNFSLFLASVIIVLFAPFIINMVGGVASGSLNKYYLDQFRKDFFENEGAQISYNLFDLSFKYKLPISQIKEMFEEFASGGLIKGFFDGSDEQEEFIVEKGFKVESAETKRQMMFENEILDYLKPYKVVDLNKLASVFKLKRNYVEKRIQELITENKIMGFLDGDSLFRDLGALIREFSELVPCNFCNNRILPYSDYCSFCGKEIKKE